jgi:hypothetical protein
VLPPSTRVVVVALVSGPSGTRWSGPVSKRLPSRATEDGQRVKERMVEYGVGQARSAQDDARCSPSDDRTFPEARIVRRLGIILQSVLVA